MTWTVVWEYPYDGESEVTLWDTEALALLAACADIQICIHDDWDMSDVGQAQEAQYINNLISAGQYRQALDHWNICDVNTDSDYVQYWNVYEKEINDFTKAPNIIIFGPDHFTALLDEEEEEEEDEDTNPPLVPSATNQAPGATCRKCRIPNESAYADRLDGTYVCRQCKAFQSIFGT